MARRLSARKSLFGRSSTDRPQYVTLARRQDRLGDSDALLHRAWDGLESVLRLPQQALRWCPLPLLLGSGVLALYFFVRAYLL